MTDPQFHLQSRSSPRYYVRTLLAAYDYTYARSKVARIVLVLSITAGFVFWLIGTPNPFAAVEFGIGAFAASTLIFVLLGNKTAKRRAVKLRLLALRELTRDRAIRAAYFSEISGTLDAAGICVRSGAQYRRWPWYRCRKILVHPSGIVIVLNHPQGITLLYSFSSHAFANPEEMQNCSLQAQKWRIDAVNIAVRETRIPWLAVTWILLRFVAVFIAFCAWIFTFNLWVDYVSLPPVRTSSMIMRQHHPASKAKIYTATAKRSPRKTA
jgi:hypothetical protein